MAHAYTLATEELAQSLRQIDHLFDYFLHHLPTSCVWHGSLRARVKNNINISLPDHVNLGACQMLRDQFTLSSSSSCSQKQTSHVLDALNVPVTQQKRCLRIGISQHTPIDHCKDLVDAISGLCLA